MAASSNASIQTLDRASLFLSELGGQHGFEEALRRVRERSSPAVASQLESLGRFVNGQQSEPPGAEVALVADLLRSAPDRIDSGKAIGSVHSALADARSLADHVRVGLPGDLFYAVLLLAVAAIVATTWFVELGPTFSYLFGSFGADLPAYSRLLMAVPALVFAPIAVIAVMLVGLLRATQQLANRVENLLPLRGGWLGIAAGRRVLREHERWRGLVLARAWAAGGVPAGRAVAKALAGNGDAADPQLRALEAELALAEDLGVGASELERQTARALVDYARALEIRRAIALRVVQVAIAVVVASIVLAVYLPIFQMGAIV